MDRFFRSAIGIFILASFGFSLPCIGQTTSGQINGRVVDPAGQLVTSAQVQLTNETNGESRLSATDSEGEFVFVSVQPGSFTVSVHADGFKVFSKRGVVLNASDRLSVGELTMEVGTASQSVSVQADRTPVQVESGERSGLIDGIQLRTISDPARNFLNLNRLLPGVVGTGTEGQDQLGIYSIDTVNGIRSEYSSVSIDGVSASTNARAIDRVETPLNTDAIAEVKVLSNNYQAEYGGSSGSAINAITKSGTNQFHGSAYYFKRHEEFNAHDYFDGPFWNGQLLPKGLNRFNTVGYNVGGPVWLPKVRFLEGKDKLFFFFSQEIWPTVHPGDGNPLRIRVPTALERQGVFTTPIADPSKTAQGLSCVNTNDPGCYPNNTIPADQLNVDVQKLLNLLPLPTPGYTDPSGETNFVLNLVERNPVNQKVLRVDYNISPKWTVYFRGLDMTVKSQGNAAAYTPMNYLANFPVDYINKAPNVTVDLTFIASPTLVNELNLGYSAWSEQQQFPKGKGELAAVQKSALGISLGQFRPALNPLDLIPTLIFGGGGLSSLPTIGLSGPTQGRFPINSQSGSYGVSDGVTKVWPDHTSKAGVYFHLDRYVQRHSASDFAGSYDFSVSTQNPLNTGNTYANALTGNFLSYSESTAAPDVDPFTRIFDWYVQDNWKIAKTLTLDYGLRFSFDLPQTLYSGANFVPSAYNVSQAPVLYKPALSGGMVVGVDPRNGNQVNQALIGAVVPGSGNPFDGLVTTKKSNPVQGQGLRVAPRFGFAWDVFGNGKTSIRGGTGIFYNTRQPSAVVGNLGTNPPVLEDPKHPFGNVSQLFTNGDTGLIFPSNLSGSVQTNAVWPVFYNSSLGFQQRFGFQSVLDVAYVGTLGQHLGQTVTYNALAPGTRFLPANQDPTAANTPLSDNFLRPYVGLGSIPFTEFTGRSNYNSLQVSLNRRFTSNFSFGLSYTWSKALDYSDKTFTILPSFAPLHAYSYGLASFDRDHVMKVNGLWSLPKASRLLDSWVTRTALDNWQVSGIASFVRGMPFGINLDTGGVDLTGGTDAPRAQITGKAVLSHGDRHALRYFNTASVSLPSINTVGAGGQYSNFVGNAGKAVFRGPGINNWDVTLMKNFSFTEKVTVQIRGEFFNLFNHPSFNNVDNNAVYTTSGEQTNNSFGRVSGDTGPRVVQLAGKISF